MAKKKEEQKSPDPKKPEQKGKAKPKEVSKSTLLPISFVLTILAGVAIGVWGYAELVHKVNNLEREVEHLRSHIDERTASRFTREDFDSEFSSWVRIFQASNTTNQVTIPDADDR